MIKADIDEKNRMNTQTQSTMVTYKRVERRNSDCNHSVVYAPIYHYTVDGKNYQCYTNSASSFRSGKNRTVYYQTYDPEDCFVDENDFVFKTLFFIAGLIAALCGICGRDKR